MNAPLSTFERFRIKGFELLEELALNLKWSWNHRTDWLWQQLDQQLWEDTHNPLIVLRSVSIDKLKLLLADKVYRKDIKELVQLNRQEASLAGWFQENYKNAPLSCVAYFSMEYMLSEALPIYSGGLGNVSGDQLKAASDLGLPVAAVGLLYQQGYFRQVFNQNGTQEALYPYNDPGQLPIVPLRKKDGEWLRLEIQLPGHSIWLRTWQVQVGKNNLYLLDSNDMANYPAHRGITTELYGGGLELRLKQEILLGIAGWRLLEALDIAPEVCHLNEGHAAFALLERASSYMQRHKVDFEVAFEATRAGNLFTTHTAVAAGFDCFPAALLEKYLGNYVNKSLKISFERFLQLGRQNPLDNKEYFNMAFLAMRGSAAVNAVSQIHAEVSKKLFAPLFPRWPLAEIPIGFVTNGVHMPSWDAKAADELWSKSCGKARWLDTTEELEKHIKGLSDQQIWSMRQRNRAELIEYARKRLSRQLASAGAGLEEVEATKHKFNTQTLTLGFARRFATYKRPNLLLMKPQRLLRLLNHPTRPVQLIIAGKAHPADEPGKALIKDWNAFIKHPEATSTVMFLSDYDLLLTEKLVQGVDVWINTPRRPWEACGTSGMKVLVNGGLNLSVLDGWWAEAYDASLGWALGGNEYQASDEQQADELYDLLEQQIIPEFYLQSTAGLPLKWIERIRSSMARLTPHYSSNRSVREYVEKYYVPQAEKFKQRAANNSQEASQLAKQKAQLAASWKDVYFGQLQVKQLDDKYEFTVPVHLNGINASSVKVELYADSRNLVQKNKMTDSLPLAPEGAGVLYIATVPADRPLNDYTPRIVPSLPGLNVPLEASEIVWQK